MATNSGIEWTHHTANLWWGCTRVHKGCDNCYAAALSNRWGKDLWDNEVREYKKQVWKDLPKWQKAAEEAGEMHRVFVGSMMDIFEKPMSVIDSKGQDMFSYLNESQQLSTDILRDTLFQHISTGKYPNLIFLFLTKRPSNINKYIPDSWRKDPPRNVMFGASVVDQKSAWNVAKHLKHVNGPKFLSIEPLLDSISLTPFMWENPNGLSRNDIDWLIVGGESGPKARPFDPEWARRIRDQSGSAAFFMKQMGGKKKPFEPIPDDLMIREFPDWHYLVQ